MLRQPVQELLSSARSVLIAGAGGGYDVLGAVPLLMELRAAGSAVHLASLTFTDASRLETTAEEDLPNLVPVYGASATHDCYCPEAWLARWVDEELGAEQPVWLLGSTGVQPLRRAYERLVEKLALDAIVLIDGGIDAALRGDEFSIGTPGEDLTSLAAVWRLSGVKVVLACLGMGSEMREGIAHAQFLERVAELTRAGGFLGVSALSQLTEPGQAYLRALDFVTKHQAGLHQSHVQGVVRKAMLGEFGTQGEHMWLSPLLPLYWFFAAQTVASTHLFLSAIEDTTTAWQVNAILRGLRTSVRTRGRVGIPI